MNYFTDTAVNILGNSKLRTPQIEAYIKAQEHFASDPEQDALIRGTHSSSLCEPPNPVSSSDSYPSISTDHPVLWERCPKNRRGNCPRSGSGP